MTRSSITFQRSRNASRVCSVACCLITALAAVSFLTAPAFGQSSRAAATKSKGGVLAPIKDFINKDTLADVDAIKLDQFDVSLQELFDQALELTAFESQYADACRKEFQKTIEGLNADVQSASATFKEKYGVSQIYYVLQTTRGEGASFVVPIKGVSEAKVNALKERAKNLKMNSDSYKDCLLVSRTPLKELGAFYKDFEPSANKNVETYFSENADKMIVGYCGRLKIRPFFHATEESTTRTRQYDPFANSPRSVKDFIEVVDSSFVNARGYFDASKMRVFCEFRFSTPVNANKCRAELVNMLDAFNTFYFKILEATPGDPNASGFAPGVKLALFPKEMTDAYHMYQWTRDLYTAIFAQYLPVQDDAVLRVDISALSELKKIRCNTLAVAYFAQNVGQTYARIAEQARALASPDGQAQSNPFTPLSKHNLAKLDKKAEEAAESGESETTSNPFEDFLVGTETNDETQTENDDDSDSSDPTSKIDEDFFDDGADQ